ncbi:hypothetical protein PORY_002631 [Pneumocystis oryctolagi]|uniref:Uncharacterized protein n=1 Tax=Pneumocystis oryctolagi TaxID=42067 RepID=A0ACB7CAM5_9ASCO|nr:hypothetical protein PORY_002631 [Pneumocystis oryctolagi]
MSTFSAFFCVYSRLNNNKQCNLSFLFKRIRKFSQSAIRDNLRAFRACIIGSGPAGFYTANRLLKGIPGSEIDMYEAFPVPFGLLRFGVAPDHDEIKNVQNQFSEIAKCERFHFIGNVRVGSDVSLKQLKPYYDCMVMAYGASKDRELGIPGEKDIQGIYSARSFVGWYNGHYEFQELNPDLESSDLAVIIGHGNVALDIARILLIDPKDLEKTDITEKALECLRKSKIKRVKIIGRRGPMQMSFSTKELRKLTELSMVSFYTPDLDLYINQSLLSDNLTQSKKRLFDLLLKKNTLNPDINNKLWSLDFLLSARQFIKHESKPNTLSSVLFEKNVLKKGPNESSLMAVGTGELVNIDTNCLIRSIGYKGVAIENSEDIGIPFDSERGIIPNVFGRVLSSHKEKISDTFELPGIYTSGWIKTGPVGVIVNTMYDAFETSDSIIEDWNNGKMFLNPTNVELKPGFNALLSYFKDKNIQYVQWKEWQKLDELENKKGKELGKIRKKFTSIKEILEIIK